MCVKAVERWEGDDPFALIEMMLMNKLNKSMLLCRHFNESDESTPAHMEVVVR